MKNPKKEFGKNNLVKIYCAFEDKLKGEHLFTPISNENGNKREASFILNNATRYRISMILDYPTYDKEGNRVVKVIRIRIPQYPIKEMIRLREEHGGTIKKTKKQLKRGTWVNPIHFPKWEP